MPIYLFNLKRGWKHANPPIRTRPERLWIQCRRQRSPAPAREAVTRFWTPEPSVSMAFTKMYSPNFKAALVDHRRLASLLKEDAAKTTRQLARLEKIICFPVFHGGHYTPGVAIGRKRGERDMTRTQKRGAESASRGPHVSESTVHWSYNKCAIYWSWVRGVTGVFI